MTNHNTTWLEKYPPTYKIESILLSLPRLFNISSILLHILLTKSIVISSIISYGMFIYHFSSLLVLLTSNVKFKLLLLLKLLVRSSREEFVEYLNNVQSNLKGPSSLHWSFKSFIKFSKVYSSLSANSVIFESSIFFLLNIPLNFEERDSLKYWIFDSKSNKSL